jgi:hypothetical protein
VLAGKKQEADQPFESFPDLLGLTLTDRVSGAFYLAARRAAWMKAFTRS